MQPAQIIILLGAAVTAFLLWQCRAQLARAIGAAAVNILDAILVGVGVYLAVAIVFDFSALRTWEGASRIFLFTSKPDGIQFFAISAGILMGVLRLFQPEAGNGGRAPTFEYKSGRRIWCHRSALVIANSLLAKRADELKLKRPQHLEPDRAYSQPLDQNELDKILPIPDIETDKALTPYASKRGEYATAFWGMLRVPYEETTQHFLAVGSTGSGKTVLIQTLMRSVLPRIRTDKSFRAFVYDDKLDFVPLARQLGLEEYVWSLDPFDANGYAWDIAADVTTPAEAMQVASVLAPVDSKVPDPYWQQATQDFLSAVLLNFREVNGSDWDLRDVILSFQTEEVLRQILARDKETQSLAHFYLGAHSLADVLAVLSSRLGRYRIPAALYKRAERKTGVREWHKKNAILLVTGRSVFSEATRPINQAIFQLVSILLLNKRDVRPRGNVRKTTESNWIFLDEIREIGKLKGYHELANKGRSKGVRMVLGFQSIEGMMVEHEENGANEIANLCAHRAFLHSDSGVTREWEAKQVGAVVVDETVFSFSNTVSKDGTSYTAGQQTQRQTRQAMEASDFDVNLKQATPENGLTALHLIPYIGSYISHVPWAWIKKHSPIPAQRFQRDSQRTGEDQRVGNWNTADLLRLGLPPTILEPPPPPPKDEEKKDDENKKGKKDRRVGVSKRKNLEA